MNGKEGGIEIKIVNPVFSGKSIPGTEKKAGGKERRISLCARPRFTFWDEVWRFCKEDSNRAIFSLKVGLAVLLVSLLILIQAPYRLFGTNIIWSILTVAIMFEYTVGATFNRGFNRALGSLLAGILAITVVQLALRTGRVAEPIIIGASIFLIGTVTSFMKLWPSLLPYEYGFRVILFTFCLIIISGYRMGNPIRTAMDRLYSIAIGAFVAVMVNVLIFPIWAGEQLHDELVKNFNSVADALEECVNKYLKGNSCDESEFEISVMDEFPDEPAYRRCKETLNSSAKLDSLASSAKWEPPHGRFRCFFHPWDEYVKVGAILRYCAYEVMALHGVLHSEIQAPHEQRIRFRLEINEVTKQAAELLKSLAIEISDMKRSFNTSLLKRVHISTEQLQKNLDMHTFLLTSTLDDYSNKMEEYHSNSLKQSSSLLNQKVLFGANIQQSQDCCNETVKKHSRKQHSWPSAEVSSFDEDLKDFLPRMKALESTATLSIATFALLLIEFVARLDHLVEAVDKLSAMAKFKQQGL